MNPHLRPRSTAVTVLSRADPRPSPGGASAHAPAPAGQLPRWIGVLKWVALGAAIVALWTLLLLGDSLRPVAG
jgi:hypothetical protein